MSDQIHIDPAVAFGKVFEAIPNFRWHKKLTNPKLILQQAWFCKQDGSIEWYDVPVHYEEVDINAAQEEQ